MISASAANGGARFAGICVGVQGAGEEPSVLCQIPYGYSKRWERRPQSQAPDQNKEVLMACSWEGKGNCRESGGKRSLKRIKRAGEKGKCRGGNQILM